MKRKFTLWLFVLFSVVSCCLGSERCDFKHPGILSTQTDLSGLKKRVVDNPSAKLGFEQLRRSRYADLFRPHTPYEVVKVVASGLCPEEEAFRKDAQAAHATALMWVITSDIRYRDKAISILNDWAATYKKIVVSKGSSEQAGLEAAWAAPIWTAAADIIRYYNDGASGWPQEQIVAFDRFLTSLVMTARGVREKDNNWGTSATLAIMAAAVYQNDAAAYAAATTLHKTHLRKISKKDGSLEADYLRDPGHPQYTILTWIQTCEIAWNQGDDLYGIKYDGQPVPRLALCLDHFAGLFLGKLPNPKGLQNGNYQGSHKNRQGYDTAFNHFVGRQNMANIIPTFANMVPDWRPGGIDNHFIAWDTLTHGDLFFNTE